MQAPLFEVKNKLSDFINQTQNGDVVEVTKHGESAAVILSIDSYRTLTKNNVSFNSLYTAWKNEFSDSSDTRAEFPYDTIRSNEREDDSRTDKIW